MELKDKLNTARDVLSSTRSRIVVVILMVIVVLVLLISYIKYKRSQLPAAGLGSETTGVPSISSIPGIAQPTREYAKLQEQQNLELATEAAKRGTAAMPTVVRATYLDTGVSTELSKRSGATSVAGCGVEELKRARAAGVTASELRCRGCSLAALKAAGYTAGELRAAGFSAQELKDAGFSAKDLRDAGFSAKELAAAGFSAKELAEAGYTAGELRDAGFSAKDLRDAGFSASDLKNVGFSAQELAAAGFSAGDIKQLGISAISADKCDAKTLTAARSRGVSASELKKLGCSAAALRAAGYTVAELRAAGFSAKELKDAGFSAGELRDAGFSAKDLKDAGFSASELKKAGFSAGELSEAGFTPSELLAAGYTQGDLIRAGIASGVISKDEIGSCSVDNLKKARAQGLSAAKLKSLGCSAAALRAAGYTAAELRAAGFSAKELKDAGFSAKDLKDAGFSAKELKDAGFSAKDLKDAGFSAKELKDAGFSAKDLKDAGFTNADLAVAGFSPEDLKAAGISDLEAKIAENTGTVVEATPDFSNLQDTIGRSSVEKIAGMSDQDIDNFVKQQQALMTMQANQLFSLWSVIPTQQYVQGEAPKVEKTNKGDLSPEEKKAEALKNSDVYKAGSVIFAALDTEVNSDENSPITATVTQGPLSGSKVIGNFQRVDQKVLLQFSVLSVPRLPTSIGITAVAMDPDTAKTALASSVDSHIGMRYGMLLASSFVSGLGQAIQDSGSQIQTTVSGSITTKPALNTAQKVMAALGTVGEKFSHIMAAKADTPPTVKVSAGKGIALLLMADLVVPKDQKVEN